MSLWEQYLEKDDIKELDQDLEVETLIIGGGMAGLNTLYFLKDTDKIALVDAGIIGNGVSKNTTGKLTYLQELIYNKLNSLEATTYLKSQQLAIDLAKEIITKEHFSCDLDSASSYVCTNKQEEISKIKKERDFLLKNQIAVKGEENPFLDMLYAIKVEDTYVFNPVKYLMALKNYLKNRKLPIYENTKVIDIQKQDGYYLCKTLKFQIKASKVIIATHYPFFLFPFFLPLKSSIEKSYLLACKTTTNNHFSFITASKPTLSFRYYQDGTNTYAIYLAASHNTCFKQNDQENFKEVARLFNLKDEDILYKWSNVDIMTDDSLPYIGEIKDNLYIATGFNTWGMTNSFLSAKIISDRILNKPNSLAFLFDPKRLNFRKILNKPYDLFSNAFSYIRSKFYKKDWYNKNLIFYKKDGLNLATYQDHGKSYTIINKCPHFGCSLIFNEVEKTWDCPCHSSRFDITGKCLKGPSKEDITYKP